MTPERLSRIEELYHSAREHEPGERAAFLAEACSEDEDLRHEVESLLDAEPAGSCFLDQPAMPLASDILGARESRREHRFAPGLHLGPYAIEAPQGSGGMGEVYRAKDTRLHRTVALKVLPRHLADTPGLRQRLEREARAISSLNRPRICTLYDIGRQDDIDYLVMEFLEGETLEQRLKRGALPLPEALELAVQAVDALAAAHAAGIVHRDLKPGNIMLTKSGGKLLDFGLAKVRTTDLAAISAAAEPITTAGMVVGTVQYMSPEQIQGQEADTRSDLFAFGATLYEMLTGKSPFGGQNQFAIVHAILEREPAPAGELQPLTTPALERVVKRCLAKDPEARWQNTRDLASELSWIAQTNRSSAAAHRVEAPGKGRTRELLYGTLAVIFLVTSIVGAVAYWRLSRTPARAIVAEIVPPGKARFDLAAYGGEVALSPDGRALAFCAADESGTTMLWVRSLNSPTAHPLAGTEGVGHPFWSADSRSIAFFAGGDLKSIDAGGGPSFVVAGGTAGDAGGSWNRDGTILFVPDASKGVYKVAATGGNPLPVIPGAVHESGYFLHPKFLPDRRHFLYVYGSRDPATGGTYFASLDGTERRLIIDGNTFAIYASGFLLYTREGTLMAEAFDPERGRLRGDPPRRVAEGVARAGGFIHNGFDASANGVLVYRTENEATLRRLTWFDRTGKSHGVTGEAGDYWDVRLSPDGKRLASNTGSPNSQIWVDDLGRAVHAPLTMDHETDHGVPVWSPDGSRIAFMLNGKLRSGIYEKYSNGVGSPELVLPENPGSSIWPTSWSRDGRFLLYSRETRTARRESEDIWVLPLSGSREPRLFVHADVRAYDGQFSWDGRWVAYTSEGSGRAEIYVVPFDAGSGSTGQSRRWQVSSRGGRSPRWRRDGKEIFYLSPTNDIMAAAVQARSDGLMTGRPQTLFRCTPVSSIPMSAPYDVSADGKNFVINSFSDDNTPLILMVDWTASLKN